MTADRLGRVGRIDRRVERRAEPNYIKIPQVGSVGKGLSIAKPTPMISATIPSIRSRLRFFAGLQLYAASVSSNTLLVTYW